MDSELSDDGGGQRSSDDNSDLSSGDGRQRIEEQRLVAYNEDKPVSVGIL